MNRKIIIRSSYHIIFGLLLNFQFFKFNTVFQLYILWVLVSLFLSRNEYVTNFRVHKKNIFYSVFWVLPLVLSLFYSEDFNFGFKKIKTILPIIITPLIYFPLNDNYKQGILNLARVVFPISTAAFGIFIILKLSLFFYEPYVIQYGEPEFLFYLKFVYEHRFGYLVNTDEITVFSQFFHKAYYSIAILISMIFILEWKQKVLKAILFMILFLLLVIFKSIPQIFVGFFIVWFLIFKNLSRKRKRLFLGLNLIIILALLLVFNDGFLNIFISKLENRGIVYECSMLKMISEPILGYGIGDVNQVLRDCYSEQNCLECINLNSHNQYFNFILSSGVIGLISIVVYYGFIIRLIFNEKRQGMFFFMAIFMISFLFENILSRMWGVFLFSIFYCLLFFENFLIKSNISER